MPAPRLLAILLIVVFAALAAPELLAHPEDEFCVPGEDSLDPELCAALAELDNPNAEIRKPLTDESGFERSVASTLGLYARNGVRHILPGGIDHILFVLALFLTSTRLRALVVQVSTFTVAHTATLGLAAAGVLSPPTNIVEPLIAATIAFVAIENLFVKDMPRWRPALVFGFGLLHGLGFASFFGEQGFPPGQFWSALIGFNIGVEIGQLGVVLMAFVAVLAARRWMPPLAADTDYRRWVVVPGSLVIGGFGLVWTVQRVLTQLA